MRLLDRFFLLHVSKWELNYAEPSRRYVYHFSLRRQPTNDMLNPNVYSNQTTRGKALQKTPLKVHASAKNAIPNPIPNIHDRPFIILSRHPSLAQNQTLRTLKHTIAHP